MKCYYEVLGVAREADDGEIKNAYRKMALKFHPDKNPDDPVAAKEQFQLVQQAYEVLSDRQERAWYDNHRDQILKGSNSDYQDNCLDVYQYFTTSCFKGYEDDETGFYAVYRGVFETLAKEEIEHLDSKSDYEEIPSFGRSSSDYDDVVAPFYAFWMSFTTKKSYAWLDPYAIKDARERRYLKLVEKENKKVRQKARKERNEEVRNLVAFIRKRDKRVQEYTKRLEQKNLENRLKHEELRKRKVMERRKELLNESSSQSQAEWTKFDNLTSELDRIEKNLAEEFGEKIEDSDEDEEEIIEDNLYCVACNKIFKNVKAFANHESSKKHKENLARIREDMEADDELDEEDEEEEEQDSEVDNDVAGDDVDLDAATLTDTEEEEEIIEEKVKEKKKIKRNKKIIRNLNISSSHDEKSEHSETEQAINTEEKKTTIVDSDKEAEFESTTKKQKKKRKSNAAKNVQVKQQPETALDEETDLPSPKTVPSTISKKKSKKQSNTKANNNSKYEEVEIDVSHCCISCKNNFESKNKLFEHLKKTGHSVMKPDAAVVKPSKKGKRNLQ